jgi:hypothetical protein
MFEQAFALGNLRFAEFIFTPFKGIVTGTKPDTKRCTFIISSVYEMRLSGIACSCLELTPSGLPFITITGVATLMSIA